MYIMYCIIDKADILKEWLCSETVKAGNNASKCCVYILLASNGMSVVCNMWHILVYDLFY